MALHRLLQTFEYRIFENVHKQSGRYFNDVEFNNLYIFKLKIKLLYSESFLILVPALNC